MHFRLNYGSLLNSYEIEFLHYSGNLRKEHGRAIKLCIFPDWGYWEYCSWRYRLFIYKGQDEYDMTICFINGCKYCGEFAVWLYETNSNYEIKSERLHLFHFKLI